MEKTKLVKIEKTLYILMNAFIVYFVISYAFSKISAMKEFFATNMLIAFVLFAVFATILLSLSTTSD
jgi:high-affinity Fe2+/Pb2+ permease